MDTQDTHKGSVVAATVAIVALALIGGGIAYVNMRPAEEMMAEQGKEMMEKGEVMKKEGEAMMEEGEKMMDDAALMEKGKTNTEGDVDTEEEESAMMEKDKAPAAQAAAAGTVHLAGEASPLIEFNEAAYAQAQADGKLVMLFFFAEWCPLCHAEFEETKAAFNELLRDDVVGLRVHFKDNLTTDTDVALAREFGVAYQHTKIFLKDGEQVIKDVSNWDKARYLNEIARLGA